MLFRGGGGGTIQLLGGGEAGVFLNGQMIQMSLSGNTLFISNSASSRIFISLSIFFPGTQLDPKTK